MLKVGEKLGDSTEFTLLMNDLHHAVPVFPLVHDGFHFIMFQSVFINFFLILFLWSPFGSC